MLIHCPFHCLALTEPARHQALWGSEMLLCPRGTECGAREGSGKEGCAKCQGAQGDGDPWGGKYGLWRQGLILSNRNLFFCSLRWVCLFHNEENERNEQLKWPYFSTRIILPAEDGQGKSCKESMHFYSGSWRGGKGLHWFTDTQEHLLSKPTAQSCVEVSSFSLLSLLTGLCQRRVNCKSLTTSLPTVYRLAATKQGSHSFMLSEDGWPNSLA